MFEKYKHGIQKIGGNMYIVKVLNDKDAGIYLDNKIVCICPVEEAAQVLYIKNFWLEGESEELKQKAEKIHSEKGV